MLCVFHKTVLLFFTLTQFIVHSPLLGNFERGDAPMPDEIHAGYERFLFEVLNGERELNDKNKNWVWLQAKNKILQNSETQRESEELRKARIQIKEYEALLEMYRKEFNQ